MRALIATSVLVIAVLTGCGTPAPTVAPPPTSASEDASAAPTSSAAEAAPGTTTTTTTPAQAKPARCHTSQLSAKLGPRSGNSDQTTLALIYTNTSSQACLLHGVPGVDLHGPNDPNGPVYSLYRKDTSAPGVTLRPGASASARLTVLSDSPGSVGSFGSKNWVPTQLITTPPGETTTLSVAWPAGLTVFRQDAATHPGSWVESVTTG
ncbi:MAG TPA: DUF4232 domain-containing protein [Pseudonocardia sp.]|nr:DUF4232 domain-containing protein [Pseudonocardia sp.]